MRSRALAGLIGALALAAGVAAAANAPDRLDRLMALLAQRRHGEVTFVERDDLRVLTRPLVSSGLLIYDAPDHLEKRTLEPRPSTFILDHGELTVTQGHRTDHLALSAYPRIAPYVQAIADTLAGNRAGLERLFQVRFAGTLAHWRLTLVPRRARRSGIRHIRITGSRADLATVAIVERNGDRSLMRLGPAPGPRG